MLIIVLVSLLIVSAFFSGSETALMALNRYRLRHLVKKQHRAALRINQLLHRTDRVLGMILIGNTFANIFASSISTILAVHYWGDYGILITSIGLTLIVLIIAEIIPKTMAALYSQPIAFACSLPLSILMKIFYPLVWLANGLANGLLSIVGIKVKINRSDSLNAEELRTVVSEASGRIDPRHQAMLLRILDMEKVTVNDVMIPRNEMPGINLEDDWPTILEVLNNTEHLQMPIYRDSVDNIEGMLSLSALARLLLNNQLSKEKLIQIAEEIYYIPEETPLHIQLLNFKEEQRYVALVVDEYGDIQGMVTLEDIMEEIVGEFTPDKNGLVPDVRTLRDGSYLVKGSANIRELNRTMDWDFPIDGPKTLSGLVIEYLESIPPLGICLKLKEYPIEVVSIAENKIETLRIFPKINKA